jgi:dimethylhistidine N-methyltransferase
MNLKASVELIDLQPRSGNILREVLVGLSKGQKTIDPKYLYDKKGSEIFEEICQLPEYYPTKAETEILKTHAAEMAQLIGEDALIIEPGSGSGEKVRFLLKELDHPAGYVPIEISREILLRTVEEFDHEFPDLNVVPVCADFTADLELPLSVDGQIGKKVIFFPGSTIGNLDPHNAVHFLKKFGQMMGHEGGLLIGVDLKKNKEVFELAYDDPKGVTASFNLNLLSRLNHEVNATFDLSNFNHKAFYNEQLGRVEMHLESKIAQLVRVNQTIFRFKEGETIHTENSYKYSVEEFCELCAKANLKIRKFWKDTAKQFCVYYFEK